MRSCLTNPITREREYRGKWQLIGKLEVVLREKKHLSEVHLFFHSLTDCVTASVDEQGIATRMNRIRAK